MKLVFSAQIASTTIRDVVRHPVLLCICLVAFAIGTSQTVTAQTAGQLRLSKEEARVFAQTLVNQSEPRAAREVALGLLRADPDDVSALFSLAAAERLLGRSAAARFAAKRAFSKATIGSEKFAAAILVAESHLRDGQHTRAQIWLRRAEPFARGAAQQAALARNYAQVARANPLTFELEFRAGPNSNINNAPKSDSLIFNGIEIAASGASLALSGTEISYGLKLHHKRPLNDGTALSFGTRLNAINYQLSGSAKAQAPEARPSDFAFYELGIDARYDAKPTANAVNALRFEIGANWYGGERLTNFAKVEAERRFRWGSAATGAIGFGITRNERLDADERSSTVASATLKRTETLAGGSRLSWSASISNTASRSALIEHASLFANITYAPAKPIFGATAEFGVSFGQRDYAQVVSIFGPNSRKDTQAGIRAQFLLEKINLYGFAPLVTLSASSTESNINRYDIRQTGVSLGIASVF